MRHMLFRSLPVPNTPKQRETRQTWQNIMAIYFYRLSHYYTRNTVTTVTKLSKTISILNFGNRQDKLTAREM